jgi:hypothetical protein
MFGRPLVAALLTLGPATAFAQDPSSEEAAAQLIESMKFDTRVELVSAGAEPRTQLKYRPKPGATATLEFVNRNDLNMAIHLPDGTSQAIPLGTAMPGTVMTMRNTVGKATANGLVPVRVEYLDARAEVGADPALAATIDASLASFRGMTFDMFVDPELGRPVQVDVAGAEGAMTDAMQTLMDEVTNRVIGFPEEPVGVGGQWRIHMGMSIAGMQMAAVQTYTVTGISKKGVDADVGIEFSLASGDMALPNLPPGASVHVDRFTGTGTGTTRIDLLTLMATGSYENKLGIGMTVAGPDQPAVSMDMDMTQLIEMRRK